MLIFSQNINKVRSNLDRQNCVLPGHPKCHYRTEMTYSGVPICQMFSQSIFANYCIFELRRSAISIYLDHVD